MFAFVLPTRLISFLHPFWFAERLLGPLPLIFMMVFLSSGLNIVFEKGFCFISLFNTTFSYSTTWLDFVLV